MYKASATALITPSTGTSQCSSAVWRTACQPVMPEEASPSASQAQTGSISTTSSQCPARLLVCSTRRSTKYAGYPITTTQVDHASCPTRAISQAIPQAASTVAAVCHGVSRS